MMRERELFSPPTWRKSNVSDDPLAKLKAFLLLNKSEGLFDELAGIAKEQLPSHYRSSFQKCPRAKKGG